MDVANHSTRTYKLLVIFLLWLITSTVFSHAQNVSSENLEKFLQKRLLNEICPVESNAVAKRVFMEYGAVFAANISVRFPDKCIFSSASEVQQFQKQLAIKNAIIRGVYIELQRAAMEALLVAISEANAKGVKITPLDGSIAARRDYSDTVRIWNSRFLPALDFWVREGKIPLEDADAARKAEMQKQVEKVIEWELKSMYFNTNFSKSIFSSSAPPGTSQHLSMLAFDVVEYANADVRDILNKFGWFQTIAADAPHFTFLGLPESNLSNRGLMLIEVGSHRYWVPKASISIERK